MGSGFSKKKKQAKLLQQQLTDYQTNLKTKEFEGVSPGNLVTLKVNGEGELLSIRIKPECVDPEDVDALQDLILAAFQDAKEKLDKEIPAVPGMSGAGAGSMPGIPAGLFPF